MVYALPANAPRVSIVSGFPLTRSVLRSGRVLVFETAARSAAVIVNGTIARTIPARDGEISVHLHPEDFTGDSLILGVEYRERYHGVIGCD